MTDAAETTDEEPEIGSSVRHHSGDGETMHELFGPAVVLALDGDWPGEPPFRNRPSAWIKYVASQPLNLFHYRSVDVCDLEVIDRGRGEKGHD